MSYRNQSRKTSVWFAAVAVLAGIGTAGQAAVILSTDFTGRTVSGDTASNITYVTNGVEDPGDLTAIEGSATPGDQLDGLFDGGGEAVDDFAPKVNTDTADNWSVTIPLTFSTGITQLTIDDIVIGGEMLDGQERHQNAVGEFPRDTDILVSIIGSSSGALAGQTLETGQQTTTWSLTFFDSVGPLVLSDSETWDLRIETLNATEDEVDFGGDPPDEAGNHTGLTDFTVNGSAIPEPATAMLLAIGGLVGLARRR